jgi:hypothetical protein
VLALDEATLEALDETDAEAEEEASLDDEPDEVVVEELAVEDEGPVDPPPPDDCGDWFWAPLLVRPSKDDVR